jgi:AAA domain
MATTVGGGVHGFPAALTSFIGRDGPVCEVAALVEEYRLVTVTGPGGVGKTRLAGQVARRVAGRFADGAWLAELAPVGDPAGVAAVVAAALGVRQQPGVPAAEAVARVLARQQLLLVLDNCEHVTGAAAQLCAGLLAACDDLRVLATSREPLAVAGEARYRLAPLSLPGPEDVGPGGSEAVALFADRARRADARPSSAGWPRRTRRSAPAPPATGPARGPAWRRWPPTRPPRWPGRWRWSPCCPVAAGRPPG